MFVYHISKVHFELTIKIYIMLTTYILQINIVVIGGALFCLALVVYAIWISRIRKKDK